ncbi:hypothetical protein GA0115246_110809 [Streptomyces sp. SolWspMP-sol7th]|nr:hypothetical protein GA0115246_110809 [Streptomyces sp. SolWspMP-sol7th]
MAVGGVPVAAVSVAGGKWGWGADEGGGRGRVGVAGSCLSAAGVGGGFPARGRSAAQSLCTRTRYSPSSVLPSTSTRVREPSSR